MAIHDSDPERRNLVVTSFIFIVFASASAGGELDSDIFCL